MPKKTVADWVAKGWTSLDLVAGASVDVAYDPATQDLVFKGQKFGADGNQLKGPDRPKVTTDETASGCSVTASKDDARTSGCRREHERARFPEMQADAVHCCRARNRATRSRDRRS